MELSQRILRSLGGASLVAVVSLAACKTPEGAGPESAESAAPSAPKPWTTRFVEEGWLVARSVEIEGPNGLLLHVAAAQDPEQFRYRSEAVDGGLRQVWERTAPGATTLRVQLDKWEVYATDRVVIVERLDEVPVTLRAKGDVSWFDAQGVGQGADQGSGAAEHVVQGLRPTQP